MSQARKALEALDRQYGPQSLSRASFHSAMRHYLKAGAVDITQHRRYSDGSLGREYEFADGSYIVDDGYS